MTSMLKVEDLHVSISNIEILRGVHLQAEQKSVIGLIGRNGAGKTTTFKTIMGFYKPRKGKIVLEGREITKLPTHIRARIGLGYVPEDARVFPWLTVKENIDLALYLAKNLDRAEEVWEKILLIFPEIKRLIDRYGYHLSGGEKKMVAIARALATSPKYLLLDEAFEGLAPVVVKRFREAVKMIVDELGIGIVVAESNINIATMIAEKVYVIERGEIIFEGTPEEVVKNEEVMMIISGG